MRRGLQKYLYILSIFVFIVVGSACSIVSKTYNSDNNASGVNAKMLTADEKTNFERLFINGLKHKTIGFQDSAQFYFLVCLEIDPNSATVMYELANIYAAQGDFISAENHLKQAVQINPDNKWYKLLLGQIYQQNKEFLQASKIYDQLIKLEPENMEYYFLNSMLLAKAEEFDDAITVYNQMEKHIGYNEQIALSRQQLYRQAGKSKDAYSEIQRLINFDPSKGEYYGVMADMYKEDGNMKKALEYYNKVLELNPENGFIHFSLATYYAQNKQYDKVYEHAKKGFGNAEVEIETKIQLYLMMISSPDEFNLSDDQIETLIKLIAEVHPDDPRSAGIYADFLIQRDKKKEAREYLHEALNLDGNSYPMWEQLVLIDNELGDYENMIIDSERALKYFPTQPLLYVLNAVGNLQLKNYLKALKALETGQPYVINNKEMEAQFEMYRAEAYYNLEDKELAFSAFEKVIQMEPDNFLAMNNYAYYLSVNGERLDKAEMLSSRVIQAFPDNPTYLDTHAWVLFKKADYRLAKFYMETALKNGGEANPVVVEHYGDILFMLNDVDNALKNWQKSLDAGNKSETLKQKIAEKRYIEGEE